MTTITFNIPKKTKKEFKKKCILDDTNITTVLLDFINEYIEKGGAEHEDNE